MRLSAKIARNPRSMLVTAGRLKHNGHLSHSVALRANGSDVIVLTGLSETIVGKLKRTLYVVHLHWLNIIL